MMLTAPVTTEQYTAVRGDHRGVWLVVPNPNTVMFKARINQASFGIDFAQITYDGVTVGAYTDVKKGWTLYFSHTDNIKEAYFRGRVRKVPTSSILYINQTSAPALDNDWVFVCKDTALHEELPRKSGNTLYWDYDRVYNQLGPQRSSLPSYMVGRLLPDGYVDFDFTPGTYSPTSGRTISSHLWDADGGTIVDGLETSEDVTIRFEAPGWYEVRHTATDSAAESNFFAVRVIVYPADYSSVIAKSLIPSGANYDPATGWTTQLRVGADDDLVEMLNETEIVIFSEDWFHEVRGSLVTNIKFGGRIRRDDTGVDLSVQGGAVQITSEISVEVEGIGAQLGRLILASMTLRRKTVATVLGEIKDLTLWRGMSFLASVMTTLTTIHSLDFDDKSNDYAYPLFTAQDRSAESALSDVAFTINAYFNWATDGRIFIARHMHYLNSTDKAALMTAANFEAVDYGKLSIRHDPVPRLGRVIGYAGSYNTVSGTTIALRAKAPAVVWGTGEGRSQLNRQVLKANLTLAQSKAETAVRTGAEFAAKNLVYSLDVTHPSGYDNLLFPSVHQRYTWTITASSNRRGFACDTSKYWWLQRLQIRYIPLSGDRGGYTQTSATYIEDIAGINAQVMAEIAPQDHPVYVPSMPLLLSTPFLGLPGLLFPTGPDIDPNDEQPYTEDDAAATTKPPEKSTDPETPTPAPAQDPKSRAGAVVAVANSGGLWICEDFTRTASPSWKNITPGSGITDFRFDPHSGGGYAITNNGSDSSVWRADNILNPAWRGTTLVGVWTKVRPGDSQGEVFVYAPAGDPAPVVVNISATTYNSGNGTDTGVTVTSGDLVTITCDPADTWFGGGGLTYNADGWPGHPNAGAPAPTIDVISMIYRVGTSGAWALAGTSVTFTASTTDTLYLMMNDLVGFYGDNSGSIDATISHTSAGDFANTRRSTDMGASFAPLVNAGDSPGSEGDAAVTQLGSIHVTTNGKVRQSSGGAYADTPGGTTSGTYARSLWVGATSLLVASASPVSGDTLWSVNGVATAITPSDGSNDGLVVGSNGLVETEGLILFLGDFGGTVKLARSTNSGASWAITTGLDAGAKAVRAKNTEQVYVANGSAVAYSEDGGATLVPKTGPGSSLILIEVR